MKLRKISYLAASLLVAFSLTACSNGQQKSSSSASQPQSSKISRKAKKQSSSGKETNKQNSSSRQAKKSSSQAPEARFNRLNDKLRAVLADMLLPTRDGLGQGSENLNIRYRKQANKNVVYYSVGNRRLPFNSSSVTTEKPYAVLTEIKNGNPSSFINYQPLQKGLPTKKLDANTTATTEGAAGQRYLQFNKGKYCFVIQASAQLKQDPTAKGKQVLALSKQYQLPATASHGSVQVRVGDGFGSLNTVIAWQNGHDIYQLKAHDTATAFKMLASLR